MLAYAAILVVIATFIQSYLHIKQLAEERSALDDWQAASYLRSEVGFWRPVRRFKRGREVRRLLKDDPVLKKRITRVEWSLKSWELLCLAYVLIALHELFGFG